MRTSLKGNVCSCRKRTRFLIITVYLLVLYLTFLTNGVNLGHQTEYTLRVHRALERQSASKEKQNTTGPIKPVSEHKGEYTANAQVKSNQHSQQLENENGRFELSNKPNASKPEEAPIAQPPQINDKKILESLVEPPPVPGLSPQTPPTSPAPSSTNPSASAPPLIDTTLLSSNPISQTEAKPPDNRTTTLSSNHELTLSSTTNTINSQLEIISESILKKNETTPAIPPSGTNPPGGESPPTPPAPLGGEPPIDQLYQVESPTPLASPDHIDSQKTKTTSSNLPPKSSPAPEVPPLPQTPPAPETPPSPPPPAPAPPPSPLHAPQVPQVPQAPQKSPGISNPSLITPSVSTSSKEETEQQNGKISSLPNFNSLNNETTGVLKLKPLPNAPIGSVDTRNNQQAKTGSGHSSRGISTLFITLIILGCSLIILGVVFYFRIRRTQWDKRDSDMNDINKTGIFARRETRQVFCDKSVDRRYVTNTSNREHRASNPFVTDWRNQTTNQERYTATFLTNSNANNHHTYQLDHSTKSIDPNDIDAQSESSEFTVDSHFTGDSVYTGDSDFTGEGMFKGESECTGDSEFTGKSGSIHDSYITGVNDVVGGSNFGTESEFTASIDYQSQYKLTQENVFDKDDISDGGELMPRSDSIRSTEEYSTFGYPSHDFGKESEFSADGSVVATHTLNHTELYTDNVSTSAPHSTISTNQNVTKTSSDRTTGTHSSNGSVLVKSHGSSNPFDVSTASTLSKFVNAEDSVFSASATFMEEYTRTNLECSMSEERVDGLSWSSNISSLRGSLHGPELNEEFPEITKAREEGSDMTLADFVSLTGDIQVERGQHSLTDAQLDGSGLSSFTVGDDDNDVYRLSDFEG
uniref:AlNc14C209G8876 protein n=1 Tax=Albugo laibachii Nc14 TaxID=890382 RepID=F0WR68_9STRA|nr:AlNc14C209G8876 [Albugo laibachii Nc14]|eukprot:CCA23829.1 AlNc14C209G8876 [Albugo laibachii Nc14]